MLQITIEKIRLLVTVVFGMITGAVASTGGLVFALSLAWIFNMWCGMRADGITIITCKNFSWGKFLRAVTEFILLLCILELIAIITYVCGDPDIGFFACKTLNYAFIVMYLENSLKNLTKAYPKNKKIWIVYLFIRLDFKRILKINELLIQYEQHLIRQNDGTYTITNSDSDA